MLSAVLTMGRQEQLEYYSFGHDTPESLWDKELFSSPEQTISFIFAGIGDARNLYATLMHIIAEEKMYARTDRKYHFTVVDIKGSAIARDVLIMSMLGEAASHREGRQSSLLTACLFYTYISPIMPPEVYDILQTQIQKVIDILEGRLPLPAYLDIPSMYREALLKPLRNWQYEAASEYPASKMRKLIREGRREERMQMATQQSMDGVKDWPTGCKKESAFYEETGILLVPGLQQTNVLRKAYDDFRPGTRAVNPQALSLVDETWKPMSH